MLVKLKETYYCNTCGKKTITGMRDEGLTPNIIGCTNQGCFDGKCHKSLTGTDQNLEPELMFIRPNTRLEWDAVGKELLADIYYRHPKKSDKKIAKLLQEHMGYIQNYVIQGGLIMLPTKDAEALTKVLTVSRN